MKRKPIKKWIVISDHLKLALKEYYLMLACALGMTYLTINVFPFNYAISDRLMFTFGLGISVSFGAAILGQREGKKILWNALAILVLVGFFYFALSTERYFSEGRHLYIVIPSYVLGHLFVAIAPFMGQPGERAKFWSYNKSLFVKTCLTLIFSLVLTGGIQLCLLTIGELLGVSLGERDYAGFFKLTMIFGSTVIFSLFTAKGIAELETELPYPKVLKFFTQFVLIPLLIVYALILYSYLFKILFTGNLPQGTISYLVLSYATVGTLALLLVFPLLAGKSRIWVSAFKRVFYYTLLPLLALLYLAIGYRINQYGLTEGRIFVLALALWFSFVSLYFIFKKEPRLKVVPGSLFVFGLALLLLPYFNVFSLSIRSQKSRFVHLLEEGHLLKNSKIDFNANIYADEADAIYDVFQYLKDRGQSAFLYDYIDPNEKRVLTDDEVYYTGFRDLFVNRQWRPTDPEITHTKNAQVEWVTILSRDKNINPQEGGILISNVDDNRSYVINGDTISLKMGFDEIPEAPADINTTESKVLHINNDHQSLDPAINAYLKTILKKKERTVDKIEIPFEMKKYRGKLIFERLEVLLNAYDSILSTSYGGSTFLLLERKPAIEN